jgi:hypothetical protein
VADDEYTRGYNDAFALVYANPPGDWRSFGSSIDPVTGKAPAYELEFAGRDEAGDPLWERRAPMHLWLFDEQEMSVMCTTCHVYASQCERPHLAVRVVYGRRDK